MRYKAMGQNRSHRLDIPQLTGGLNTASDASLIEDDELSAVCNLALRDGVLETRGAVQAIGDEPLIRLAGQYMAVNEILRQPIEIDGEPCTAILSAAGSSSQTLTAHLHVVTLSGEVKGYYAMEHAGGVEGAFAIAPCDPDTYGSAFLLYHRADVYRPPKDYVYEEGVAGTLERISDDERYAPLVMINGTSVSLAEDGTPSSKLANGVMYEGFNRLTRRYRAQFTPACEIGSTEYYVLPTRLADGSTVSMDITTSYGEVTVTMTVDGEAASFSVGSSLYTAQAYADGYVKIPRALPKEDISNSVTITCTREAASEALGGSPSLAAWFGGTQNKRGGTRLFLAGFLNDKAKLIWSDVNDPLYFPENNYMYVGDLSQRITALEKQSDMLVIFKERETFYTTYVQGEIDADAISEGVNVDVTAAQAYFPLTQLSPRIGCRCPNSIALCRDRLVWMDSDARVYTLVVSGAYSERNVREIGDKVMSFLLGNTTESQRKVASAADHDGKYRLLVGRWMLEFDYSDNGFAYLTSYASGERAARHLAWLVHRFDGFGDAAQALVSDGADKALLISTARVTLAGAANAHEWLWSLYTIDAEGKDRYLVFDSAANVTVSEQPITASLTTKTYELGDPAAFKRLEALFPSVQTAGAAIYVIADGKEPTSGRYYQSDELYAHLVIPGIKRCRTFALKLDATEHMRIRGLRLQYAMFGTVR